MGSNGFPARRDDGTFSIGARFRCDSPGFDKEIEDVLWDFLDDPIAGPSEWEAQFSCAPTTRFIADDVVEVVFEGRAGADRWSSWAELLTEAVVRTLSDVTLVGFWDLVSHEPHPAGLVS